MQATIQYIQNELKEKYPEREIDGFIREIFESVMGWDYTRQVLNREEKIARHHFLEIAEMVNRLKSFEPIQHITGKARFMDLEFEVNSSVLIPRPETEELIRWIVSENRNESPSVLDIGTGSGCIAVSIKHLISKANVTGTDISEQALEVARRNATLHQMDVDFVQRDILNWKKYHWSCYEVIISNPPYVRESEKQLMQKNVLAYEPHNALFVPDHDPLLFYRHIAQMAKMNLAKDGQLYFEINEELGIETKDLLKDLGFHDVEIKKDLNEKIRMVRCRK